MRLLGTIPLLLLLSLAEITIAPCRTVRAGPRHRLGMDMEPRSDRRGPPAAGRTPPEDRDLTGRDPGRTGVGLGSDQCVCARPDRSPRPGVRWRLHHRDAHGNHPVRRARMGARPRPDLLDPDRSSVVACRPSATSWRSRVERRTGRHLVVELASSRSRFGRLDTHRLRSPRDPCAVLGGSLGLVRTLWVLGRCSSADRRLAGSFGHRVVVGPRSQRSLPMPHSRCVGGDCRGVMEHPRRLRNRPVGSSGAPRGPGQCSLSVGRRPGRGSSPHRCGRCRRRSGGHLRPCRCRRHRLRCDGPCRGALVTINPTGVARLVAATVGAALVARCSRCRCRSNSWAAGFHGIRLPTGELAMHPPNRSPTFCALRSGPIRPRFSPGHSSSP